MAGTGDNSFFLGAKAAELVGERAASDVPERKNEKGVDKERKVCYNRIRGLGTGLHRAKRITPRSAQLPERDYERDRKAENSGVSVAEWQFECSLVGEILAGFVPSLAKTLSDESEVMR